MYEDHSYSSELNRRLEHRRAMELSARTSRLALESAEVNYRVAEQATSAAQQMVDFMGTQLEHLVERSDQQLKHHAEVAQSQMDQQRDAFDRMVRDGDEQRKITRHAMLLRKFEAAGYSTFEAFELAYEQVIREEEQYRIRAWNESQRDWIKLRPNGDLNLAANGADYSSEQTYQDALTVGHNPDKIIYIRTPQQIAEGKAQ